MSVSKRKTKSRKRKIEDVENDTNIVLSAGTNPTKRRRLNDTEDGNKENKNNIFNGKDPKSYTVKQLKDLCRKQKLKVGGNKTQLIARLLNPPKAEKSAKAKNKSRTGRLSTKRVDNMLKGHGVNNPQSVSNCLKKGIQRGHVIIDSEEGLDGILIEGSCRRFRWFVAAQDMWLKYAMFYINVIMQEWIMRMADRMLKCSVTIVVGYM
eukprot:826828_1